jgi:O-antigen ligase
MRSPRGILPLGVRGSLSAAAGWISFVCLLLVQFRLYFSPSPVSPELAAGAGLLAVLAALIGKSTFCTCLDLPLTAYVGIGLVSAVIHDATPAWSATLVIVLLYYGLAYAIRDPFRLRLTLACTVICQVLVGVLALYYHAEVGFGRRLEVLYLAVSQWSGYPEVGFLQALAIPSAFAMVVAGPTRLARVAGLLLSATIAAVAVGLSSRGAWVAAAAAYLTIAGIEITRFRRVRLTVVLPVAAAMVVGVWYWSPLFRQLVQGFIPSQGAPDNRMDVVKAAFVLVRDNPWFGVGPGHFRQALAGTDVARRAAYATAHAHNMYLHVAAEVGLPGLLAFLWLWWRALRSLVRGLASDDRLDLVRIGLFGAVVAFMVRGMTDHFLGGLWTAPRFNVVLWTLFAMVAALDRLRKERGATAPAPSPDYPPTIAPA